MDRRTANRESRSARPESRNARAYSWQRRLIRFRSWAALLACALAGPTGKGDDIPGKARDDIAISDTSGALTTQVAWSPLSVPSLGGPLREAPGPSTRRTAITLSEVHHHPPPDGAGRDLRFIELYNSNPFPEDLSGWSFRGDVDFTLPEGTLMPGLGYLVVAPRPGDIEAVYGITNRVGGFATRLGPGRFNFPHKVGCWTPCYGPRVRWISWRQASHPVMMSWRRCNPSQRV